MYTCYDHEPRTEIVQEIEVRTGWTYGGRRTTRPHRAQYRLAQCVHGGRSEEDPKCEGCRWVGHKGEP